MAKLFGRASVATVKKESCETKRNDKNGNQSNDTTDDSALRVRRRMNDSVGAG